VTATTLPRRGRPRRSGRGPLVERISPIRAILAWIIGALFFFPVLYLFVTGFKTEASAVALPPSLLPFGEGPISFTPTLENFQVVLDRGFAPFFMNSVISVVASSLLVLVLALPCAYALVWRHKGRGRDILFFFLSTKFLPAVGVIVPIFVIARDLKLIDNLLALVIMYTSMNLPIAVWMLRSFFDEIPRDILDASKVDGASVREELFGVALPMITPGLIATLFILVIFAWNEFFFAVNLMAAKGATVPMFMIGFVTSEGLFWAKLAAAGTMGMLPVVLLGWAAQRQLVRGLSLGAVK
jgi:sorbitol/mannitol transport system permease protein